MRVVCGGDGGSKRVDACVCLSSGGAGREKGVERTQTSRVKPWATRKHSNNPRKPEKSKRGKPGREKSRRKRTRKSNSHKRITKQIQSVLSRNLIHPRLSLQQGGNEGWMRAGFLAGGIKQCVVLPRFVPG